MKKTLFIVSFLVAPFLSKADVSCIGITSTDPITSVSMQHPLRYLNCPCNCSEFKHLSNSACTGCGHKHGNNSGALQTAKTTGKIVHFMPPTQATASCPQCTDTDWVEILVGYVETKACLQKKEPTKVSSRFSESKKK